MYQMLLRLGARQSTLNHKLLSPLTLAAASGQREMFEFILYQQRVVSWSYGPVTSAWYPNPSPSPSPSPNPNPIPKPDPNPSPNPIPTASPAPNQVPPS